MGEDRAALVSPGRARRSSSYTEPSGPGSFSYSDESSANYRAGLGGGCCHLEDTAALRMIVVWMATVAVVVFVALLVEIVNQEHLVLVGDVVSDHPSCSSIAASVLKLGGNAVDGAVAASLCLAVAVPHSVSLGGGGLMLVHDLRSNTSTVLDFLETSPASLDFRQYTDNPATAVLGPRSAGVPGLVAGLRRAHKTHGSGLLRRDCCGWGDLLRPTLTLLARGFRPSGDWAEVRQQQLQEATGEQQFRDFLKNDGYTQPEATATKEVLLTLKTLFENPVEHFYSGAVGQRLVADLGGHLSRSDLVAYGVEEREALLARVGEYTVATSPAPSAGPEMVAMLRGLEQLVDEGEGDFSSATYLSRLRNLLEGLHGQARLLGDPGEDLEHEEEPHYVSVEERSRSLASKESLARWSSGRGEGGRKGGDAWQAGSHLAVMDEHDLYVSTVLSLGGQFGSRTFSQGFLLNNALASFDLSSLLPQGGEEAASSNLLGEARRPLSRMAPVVAVNTEHQCGLRLLAGSALVEDTAQVLAPLLLSPNGDATRALRFPKLVMVNNTARAEAGLEQAVLHQLEQKEAVGRLSQAFSPASVLEKVANTATGFTDHRGGEGGDGRWATLTPRFVNT